ncbi:MAG: flagellar assembly protein FliX [Rhodospirillaceae bacterium]|nr:flagellar assembly protein FliX [Rhodospirillaceae bacterium]
MKVSKVKSGKSASSVSRKKVEQGHGAAFAEHLKGATAGAGLSASTEAGAVSAVDAILAVQETDDQTQQRARRLGVQYGGDVLEQLEDLRRDLLMGAIEKEKLSSLAQKMRAHRRQIVDPKLNEIIDEIELRAEVEIAKLTRKSL